MSGYVSVAWKLQNEDIRIVSREGGEKSCSKARTKPFNLVITILNYVVVIACIYMHLQSYERLKLVRLIRL